MVRKAYTLLDITRTVFNPRTQHSIWNTNEWAAVERQDGGQAMIVQFDNADEAVVVRLQSWDPTKEHTDMSALIGKKVRITVEVIED